jgi:hypothetical protein
MIVLFDASTALFLPRSEKLGCPIKYLSRPANDLFSGPEQCKITRGLLGRHYF